MGKQACSKRRASEKPWPFKNDPVWGSANEMDFFLLWVTNSFKEKGWNGGGGEEEKRKRMIWQAYCRLGHSFTVEMWSKEVYHEGFWATGCRLPKRLWWPRPRNSNIHVTHSRGTGPSHFQEKVLPLFCLVVLPLEHKLQNNSVWYLYHYYIPRA